MDVSDNLLTEINYDFTKATHLSTVNFSNNKIKSCVIKSTSIHILKLSMNLIEVFPALPNCIVDLNISKNLLTEIPDTINIQLPNIKSLDLSENKIVAVPKSLSTLKLKGEKI